MKQVSIVLSLVVRSLGWARARAQQVHVADAAGGGAYLDLSAAVAAVQPGEPLLLRGATNTGAMVARDLRGSTRPSDASGIRPVTLVGCPA